MENWKIEDSLNSGQGGLASGLVRGSLAYTISRKVGWAWAVSVGKFLGNGRGFKPEEVGTLMSHFHVELIEVMSMKIRTISWCDFFWNYDLF